MEGKELKLGELEADRRDGRQPLLTLLPWRHGLINCRWPPPGVRRPGNPGGHGTHQRLNMDAIKFLLGWLLFGYFFHLVQRHNIDHSEEHEYPQSRANDQAPRERTSPVSGDYPPRRQPVPTPHPVPQSRVPRVEQSRSNQGLPAHSGESSWRKRRISQSGRD